MTEEITADFAEEITVGSEEMNAKPEIPVSVDSWWLKTARWSLYAAAFLFPVLYAPITVPSTLIREAALTALAAVGIIAWLGESLLRGSLRYKRTLLNPIIVLLLAVFLASAFFSPQGLSGVLRGNELGDKFAAFLMLGALYFLAAATLQKPEQSRKMTRWFLGGGFLLTLLVLTQFFAPQFIPFAPLARADVNTIGTVNAMGIVLGVYLVVVLGLVANISPAALKTREKLGLYLFLVFLAAALLVVNLRAIWVSIAVASIILLGFKFLLYREAETRFKRGAFFPIIATLVAAIFFVLSGIAPFRIASIPAEVFPSYSATLAISQKVLQNHAWLGSGPGTFGLDYSLYRDRAVNQTDYWGARFNSGAAFLPTMAATTGVLGFLTLLAFMAVALATLMRRVTGRLVDDPVFFSGIAAIIYVFSIWLVFSASLPLQVALFLILGVMISLAGEREGETRSFWGVRERVFAFSTPWSTFSASLFTIFLMVGAVAIFYYAASGYAAATVFQKGANLFSRGSTEEGLKKIEQAASLDTSNDFYFRSLSQAYLSKLQSVVQKAAAGDKNVQAEFQSVFSAAIAAAERSAKINPADSLNWSALAAVYQAAVPYIQGADQFAIQSYDKALALDPSNPAYDFSKASVYLALADRIQLILSQTQLNREAIQLLTGQRSAAIASAKAALEHSLSLKPDFAQSNYLFAQLLIREGDTAKAIERVEALKQFASLDVGVAFQLGVLYYQSGLYDRAEQEFARAVDLNGQYSNARYFLGLIYDRKGNRAAAIREFEKIEALNPDNQEVKTILANLRAGRPALASITPPARNPSERSEPPVKDSGTLKSGRER